jgi:hypothetical protein
VPVPVPVPVSVPIKFCNPPLRAAQTPQIHILRTNMAALSAEFVVVLEPVEVQRPLLDTPDTT